MKRVLVSAWTPAILFALLTAVAHAQTDDATAQAKQHFESARVLYKQAAYREAITEFQKAYNLVPNASSSGLLLYNIANCHEKLGDVPAALRAYKDYLRGVPTADDRSEVMTTITNLEKRLREKGVQQVRVYSNPPGAQVAINGENKGITPFSIELVPGKYFLTLTKKGFRPVEKDFAMSGDTSLELDFALNEVKFVEAIPAPAPAPVPAPAPAPAPKPPDQIVQRPPETAVAAKEMKGEGGGRVWTWIMGGVGVAAIGGGVTFGVLAKGAESDLHSADNKTRTQQDAQSLAEAAQNDALLANIMFGVGGAMVVGSVVLFFVEGKGAKTALQETPLPSLGISTNPRTGSWVVTLGGDF